MKDAREGLNRWPGFMLHPLELTRLTPRGSNPLHINAGSPAVILYPLFL